MTSRLSTAAPILAALAIALVMLGAYVGGYFWLGSARHSFFYFGEEESGPPDIIREFPTYWLCRLYQPMGKVESWCCGKKVGVWPRSDDRVDQAIRDWERRRR